MKIVLFFGTRPEAIKMFPIINEIKKNAKFKLTVISTGQHSNLLKTVYSDFSFFPDYEFKIQNKDRKSISTLGARILINSDRILKEIKPDIVLVHGDTASAYYCSLASFNLKIPIHHVEAGLRTHDLLNPYPEEAYRQMISKISTVHYAPTLLNKKNLLKEGINAEQIFVVGNSVIDSIKIISHNKESIKNISFLLDSLKIEDGKIFYKDKMYKGLVLITLHRRENIDFITDILEGIIRIKEELNNYLFLYPVHPNPIIKDKTSEISFKYPEEIIFIDHIDYLGIIKLMKISSFIITDSGGIQEEAPYFKTPVFVARNSTERIEAVKSGTVVLVGNDKYSVYNGIINSLNNPIIMSKFKKTKNPYGTGNTSKQIIKCLNILTK